MIEPLSDAKIRYEPYASWKSLDRASSSSSSAVEKSALPTKTLFFSEKRHLNSRIRVSNFEFQFLNCFKQLFWHLIVFGRRQTTVSRIKFFERIFETIFLPLLVARIRSGVHAERFKRSKASAAFELRQLNVQLDVQLNGVQPESSNSHQSDSPNLKPKTVLKKKQPEVRNTRTLDNQRRNDLGPSNAGSKLEDLLK